MRTWGTLAAALAGAGGLAAAASIGSAQHRQAGAHEHGRGTLNIALEGSRLSMELEAPGMDIAGFEHKAKTKKQEAAIASAKKRLAVPQTLFQLPASAGCVLKEAKVALEGEDHDDEHSHKDDGGKDDGSKSADVKADHDHEHSGFRAEYAFDCKAPANLTIVGFDYFKAFAGAQKLDVTVITPKGQSKFEVSRARPRLDLGGMM
jgi:hypothetical protein